MWFLKLSAGEKRWRGTQSLRGGMKPLSNALGAQTHINLTTKFLTKSGQSWLNHGPRIKNEFYGHEFY